MSLRTRVGRSGVLAAVVVAVAAAQTAVAAADSGTLSATFSAPTPYHYANGDTYFNTVADNGDILATTNDTTGWNDACKDGPNGPGSRSGSDIGLLRLVGDDASNLTVYTVNCMYSFGLKGGYTEHGEPPNLDGCSWKTGGITRIGSTVYMAVARQLRSCSADQSGGLQPSFNATIMKSTDDGRTWVSPWDTTPTSDGDAPPYSSSLGRYRAMFPGQGFSAPFFVQYGPGNTQTVDGADRYLYAVSNDGYAYNGNYMMLARVPLNQVQTRSAWQFYSGAAGGGGTSWSANLADATHLLQVPGGVSQPAIQWVPALQKYILTSFTYTHASTDFPTAAETPYTRFQFYSAPHPWGPWTQFLDHSTTRSLWCADSTSCGSGDPSDPLGFYDPALVQKYVFTHTLNNQVIFTSGDFKNQTRYYPEINLYRLRALPMHITP